jgi:hypothetical protein
MGKLIGKYPMLALILIWVTLVGAAWVLPSEPRPQILTAQRAWVRNLPSGIAAVHRLIIARSQTDLKAPTIRCRASEVAAFHCTSAPVQRPAKDTAGPEHRRMRSPAMFLQSRTFY